MNATEIIGAVGAARLRKDREKNRQDSESGQSDNGTARYMLNMLRADQVAAICRAVLTDDSLSTDVTIRVPRSFVSFEELPEAALTDENAAYSRNAICSTPVLVIANTLDDLGDTLRDIERIGAAELKGDPGSWVKVVRPGLPLPETDYPVWEAALTGLLATEDVSLDQFAGYVQSTRECIEAGQTLVDALGWALPILHMPRDSGRFRGIKPTDQNLASKWKKLYQQIISKQRPLLRKQSSGRSGIDQDALHSQFGKVRDQIATEAHDAIEKFILASPGWTEASVALANFEWERQGIQLLFDDLKATAENLGTMTIQFFDMHRAEALNTNDQEYLLGLSKRKNYKEPREEDTDFYERYRSDLNIERQLRAKWDKFIYGKGIEHHDFLIGLLLSIEKLYEQAGDFVGNKTLKIHAQYRTKGQWLAINADVLTFFSIKYKGIVALTEKFIEWETSWLFKTEELFESIQNSKKYKKSTSVARAAKQIKFDIELLLGQGALSRRVGTQLIWLGRPEAIGMELCEDLTRLVDRPFVHMTVQQRSVSRKGHLQSAALADTGTLEPAYDKDAGSLVASIGKSRDFSKEWLKTLTKAKDLGRITPPDFESIKSAWDEFSIAYKEAISSWLSTGLAGSVMLNQAELYGALLERLTTSARGDLNRHELWVPILKIGIAEVDGGDATAIVAPWHPLRLAGSIIKLRSLAGLVGHVITSEDVNFGDTRLFFKDLVEEFSHPYYPEVVMGSKGGSPALLSVTETLNEYSLAESPVMDPNDNASSATHEDPANSAKQIGSMVRRYLDLQPHEHANLSVALYNCDSTGLPLATVNTLWAFSEDEEVRCNIVLRHHNNVKLGQLYGQMLESADSDPDALIASETSRDFMAKLRIGIMLDPEESSSVKSGIKAIDIAFLQDVVARRSKIHWIVSPKTNSESLRRHVPPRWAYKRSAAEDELKSTSYLSCPRQPAAGWSYLNALYGVVEHIDPAQDMVALPARQIFFQDKEIHTLFSEVHNLAEWVINYDDLLDKRQLLNQGISVIRHQRQRSNGRNLIISSTSPLRLLKVMVKRRLDELHLSMTEEKVNGLADRLIREAAELSGDIVLRAAKRGVFAGELIGIVLSKALICEELGNASPTGWFFLDDYASWLGQQEGRIADILSISPIEREGKLVLRVIVSEAKYITASSLADERRSSQHQLTDTVIRIQDALFGDPGRLDRDLWLARLSDLLLDSGKSITSDLQKFESLRDAVRKGSVDIELKGYSHVFVSGPQGAGTLSEQHAVPGISTGLQEVFDRETLRRMLVAFESGQDLMPIRTSAGDEKVWEIHNNRRPTEPISWLSETDLKIDPSTIGPIENESPLKDDDSPGEGGQLVKSESPDGPTGGGSSQSSHSPSDPNPDLGVTSESISKTSPNLPSNSLPGLYGPAFERVLAHFTEIESPGAIDTEWLIGIERSLKSALLGYRLSARTLGNRLTPNAALIRFQGSDTMSVEQVDRRRSELLTTHGLRIISISGRPGEVVVAIARNQRAVVPLWGTLKQRTINRDKGGINTSFVIGVREIDGELLYLNLGSPFGGYEQHSPHTLIAGATGSGKSVLLQNLLLDICATNPPSLAHVYLIDPKFGVDYPALRNLPHLVQGVITDQEPAKEVLTALVSEMQRRYKVFAEKGVNSLERYNASVNEKSRLPAIWLVHDEFAEWMMTEDYKDAVSDVVARLGVMARAAGIYLIFAAQRPDRDVFPMQLRENLGNRLVLRVQGAGTSEIALGMKGAESLLGKGHLAARLGGEPDIIYAQVPFLSGEELSIATSAIMDDVSEA